MCDHMKAVAGSLPLQFHSPVVSMFNGSSTVLVTYIFLTCVEIRKQFEIFQGLFFLYLDLQA